MKKLIQVLSFLFLASQLCSAQWVQIGLSNKSIKDIEAKDSDIFVITSDSGIVFHSTNSGMNWDVIIDSNANDIDIYYSGKLFLVKDDSLFYSANNGEDWAYVNVIEQIADSLPSNGGSVHKIFLNPNGTIFCHFKYGASICIVDGFALSEDGGITWITPNLIKSGKFFAFRNECALTFGFAWCPPTGGGVSAYFSSDFGITWELGGTVAHSVLEFLSNGNIIADRSDNINRGLFISEDTCNSWTEIDTLLGQVGLSVSNGSSEYLMVGTEDFGVFLYSDEGDKIGAINEGLTSLNIQALAVDNDSYVYIGTENGLWRRPVSEITSVKENELNGHPLEFRLSQNYPNPFNPSTKINYSVPQLSQVQINVFDVLGNEIRTLVNEEKQAGTYELTWYAQSLPSGVYFYQLRAGDFIETRKMMLLR